MTGLLINIHSWRGWTQDADVDVAVDHKAVIKIMKSKHPPTTDRVKLLIRKLSPLPFTLYYVKGKDLSLADFLSHIPSDKSDPNVVLPITFVDLNLQENFSEQLNGSHAPAPNKKVRVYQQYMELTRQWTHTKSRNINHK